MKLNILKDIFYNLENDSEIRVNGSKNICIEIYEHSELKKPDGSQSLIINFVKNEKSAPAATDTDLGRK